MAACNTFSGDVTISTVASGDFSLDGLEVVTGNLTASNVTEMSSLASDSLRFVDTVVLEMNTILATVDFSKLTSLNQIQWNGLPALSEGSISMPVTSVQSIDIQSTFLSTFDGLGLDRLETVGTLWVANNSYRRT